MALPRYDIYALIHKGLRACLTESLINLGRVDLHADKELNAVLDQVSDLLAICRGHLKHENTFIHPAMDAVEPGVATEMYHHHDQHVAMILVLQAQLEHLAECPRNQRAPLAAQLYRKLAVFVADNLAHMHEEETDNNAVLWRHYSDEQIRDIEHRLVQSISPEDNARYMRWMLTAMNHQEREQLLSEMRAAAPQPVFEGVLAIARGALPTLEWGKLELALAG
ncbi:MAG: hemerythrin domain-containing protein [Pseudomonadaceae bacterium]